MVTHGSFLSTAGVASAKKKKKLQLKYRGVFKFQQYTAEAHHETHKGEYSYVLDSALIDNKTVTSMTPGLFLTRFCPFFTMNGFSTVFSQVLEVVHKELAFLCILAFSFFGFRFLIRATF